MDQSQFKIICELTLGLQAKNNCLHSNINIYSFTTSQLQLAEGTRVSEFVSG